MRHYKLFQWQAAIMLGILMLSLAFAAPVLADEAPPPPAPTEETAPEAQTAGEEETVSEEAAEEGQESAPPAETEAGESAAEILEQLPQDTELIIVDENGEVLPLASEAAEEAVLVKDPIWCPAGVAPKPGIGGCSSSFASFIVGGWVYAAR